MNKMTPKKKVVVALGVVSFAAILFIVFMVSSRTPSTTKSPVSLENGAKYGSLQPGVSTLGDVTKALGNAIKETKSNGSTILEYKSQNPNFNNELTVQSDKLTFVKQIVTMEENINISKINQQYGNYENVLYGPLSVNGFNLYIYPSKGFAYVGQQESGIVLEVWYFPPTTLDNFKSLYGEGYSDTLKPQQ